MIESRTKKKLFGFVLVVATVLTNFSQIITVKAESNSAPSTPALVAPANDNFINAQEIGGFSGSVTGTTSGASKEGGEQAHARNRGGASIWYKYVAPGNGVLTLNTNGSNFDTTVAVYHGSTLGDLTLIAANDDDLGGSTSQITIGTQLNEVLYIAVDGYYSRNTLTFASGNVQLNFSLGNVASNDNFANALTIPLTAGKLLTTTNVGASQESGEPNPVSNAGKTVWFKWIGPSGAKSYTFTVEGVDVSGTGPMRTLVAVYSGGPDFNNLNYVVTGDQVGQAELTFKPTPGLTYYMVIAGYDAGQGTPTGTFTINWGITKDSKMADFDQDGLADITVFRPTTGSWYTIDSLTDNLRIAQFGFVGDRPLLSDMGHDGKLDYTVFRPDTGTWYFIDSTAGFKILGWGISGDVPMTDHNHYRNSIAIFRPSNGLFCSSSYLSGFCGPWGMSGDIPMYTDTDGNGQDNATVFRPSNGTWYFQYGGSPIKFGQSGDKPVPADYDGDGITDIAVFRPASGTWYIFYSSTGSVAGYQWGVSGDIPQPADYDGDGKSDLAVFRSGTWYIRQSATGTMRAVQFGQAGDIPVTAPVY